MVDFIKTTELAKEVLAFLDARQVKLNPEEKMAALDAAMGTIRAVISAESMQLFYANLLTKGFK